MYKPAGDSASVVAADGTVDEPSDCAVGSLIGATPIGERSGADVGHAFDHDPGRGVALASGGLFGQRLLAGGLACLVHAVLPFLFVKTGSALIGEMHEQMVTHRRRKPLPSGALGAGRG